VKLLTLHSKHRRDQVAAAGEEETLSLPGNVQRKRRGQSLVEMALLLPLLVLMLSVVIEAGLALNAWLRVNTAARDATRFALDAGRDSDIVSLVATKLMGIDFGSSKVISGSGNLDIFVIKGTTNSSGNISTWNVTHPYDGDGSGGIPTVTSATIRSRLGQQSGSDVTDIPFVICEVDFKYTPLLGSLIARNTKLPISSYAIVEQSPNN
jgi:hypothetical protein